MKRRNTVIAILAIALIMLGTGYAYWTDTLNLTTTVTTGDLDVVFADLGLFAQYPEDYDYDNLGGEQKWSIIDGIGVEKFVDANFFMRGYDNFNVIAKDGSIAAYADRAEDWNQVTFDGELVNATDIKATVGNYNPGNTKGSDQIKLAVNKIYPGYAQAFRTDILNVGSIAARLSNIKFTLNQAGDNEISEETKNMLGVALFIEREYQEGSEVVDTFKLAASMGLQPEEIFTFGGVDFVRLSSLDKLTAAMVENANLACTPNQNRMDLFLGVAMDPDAKGDFTSGSVEVNSGKDDTLTQNKGVEIVMDLMWDQFNEGTEDLAVTNELQFQNIGQ